MPTFKPEPNLTGMANTTRTAVVLCNLGTPDAPTPGAVRRYLAEFLSDHRVVEIPRAVWLPLLYGIILPLRAAKSAAKYASIWAKDAAGQNLGSPLALHTQNLAHELALELQAEYGDDVVVTYAMRYGNPAMPKVLDALKAQGVQRVVAVPLYPQYSGTTTASVYDALFDWGRRLRSLPALHVVRDYHQSPAYIAALVASVQAHWAQYGRTEHVLMSFHGIPERAVMRGDTYQCECLNTGQALAKALGLAEGEWSLTFQSRFGKAKWIEPYTDASLKALAQRGVKSLAVLCPGFAVDCLETLEEIAMEGSEDFLHAGGERYDYIPCLNASALGVQVMREVVQPYLPPLPSLQPLTTEQPIS